VRGITIWRAGNGKLSVFFPSNSTAYHMFEDSVSLPPELRSEIEAEVIAAYREAKKQYEHADIHKKR